MKKIISITLAAILVASALWSCTAAPTEKTSTSSGYADRAWLESRLGKMPDNVTVGTAASLGIDMTDYESDGYFIRTRSGETVICGKTEDGLDRAVRKYAKQVMDGVSFDVSYHEGVRIERLTIAGRDISEYTVAYTHTVPVSTPFQGITKGNGEEAATEFIRLVKEATGITLSSVDLSVSAKPSPCILFEADESPESENPYGETAFAYAMEGDDLVFRGSGISNGCVNGVWKFFERECKWEGLTFGDSCLRESEHIDIPADLKYDGSLCFDMFEAYGNYAINDAFVTEHFPHQGIIPNACHGIQNYRFCGEELDCAVEQPCFIDDYWYDIMYQNIHGHIADRVAMGQVIGDDFTFVDVSHGDNHNWCDCKNCREMIRKEGSISATVVLFANRLSDDLEAEFPGLKYLIFAYGATKCPPKTIKTNANIYVTFCTDGACYKHSLTSGECRTPTFRSDGRKNDTFAEWIKTWAEMDGELYLWYYTMDGAFSQYNTVDVLYDDLTYFHSLGVKGIFQEGEHYGLGIGRLNFEACGVLQWDPDMTKDEFDAAIDRYIELDYGEDSVPAYRKFAELLYSSQSALDCSTCWITSGFDPTAADYSFIGERMDEVIAGIEGIIENAETYRQEIRAKRLTLALLYEGIFGRYRDAYQNGDETEITRLSGLYDLFVKRSIECGYDMAEFPLGIYYHRTVAPTLEGEAAYWIEKGAIKDTK